MRKLKKAKFINPGIYPVYIGYVNTEKAWKRLMKHLKIPNPPEFAEYGRCDQFESDSGGLAMDHIKEFKRDGECSAYTIDWLVREGAKAFKL